MSPNLEKFREEVREHPEETLEGLRDGTVSLITASSVKINKDDIASNIPRVINAIFMIMGFNTSISQIRLAFKMFLTLPTLSLIILGKELFGFALVIIPIINVLQKRPKTNVFASIIDPFDGNNLLSQYLDMLIPKHVQPKVRSFVYAFGSVSNLRVALTLLVSVFYGISLPFDSHEFDLQKIGNVLVTSIGLVVQMHDEESALSFALFRGLMTNIFFMIFAYVGHSTHQQNIASFLLDLQEGKLCQEAFELGLEEIYKRSYGEKPADVFPVADLKPFEFKGRKEEEEKGKEKTEEKKETTPEEVAEEKEKTD